MAYVGYSQNRGLSIFCNSHLTSTYISNYYAPMNKWPQKPLNLPPRAFAAGTPSLACCFPWDLMVSFIISLSNYPGLALSTATKACPATGT